MTKYGGLTDFTKNRHYRADCSLPVEGMTDDRGMDCFQLTRQLD